MAVREINGALNAEGRTFALVLSRFNSLIGEQLLRGAVDALLRHGAREEDILVVRVPGAFELPLVTRRLASSGEHNAVICLGAVIRGATPHFEYVATETIKGIAAVQQETGVPVSLGVLTTDTIEQAVERAGTKAGNKGADAALAALEMVDLLAQLNRSV